MSINSNYIQDLSNSIWSQYASREASDLMRDSKWRGIEQLGLGLAQSAIQNYVNPALTSKVQTAPVTTTISPSIKPSTSVGGNLTTKWQPPIDQSTIKMALLDATSSNPITQLEGQNTLNNFMNDQSLNTPLELPQAKPLSGTQQAISNGAGSLAGMGVGMGVSALGNKVFGDSQGAQFATQTLSQGASTIAGNVGSTVAGNIASGASAGANVGSNLSSLFSNAGSMTSLGAGVVNIGLDVFDPVKKAKWENAVNMGLGLASLIPGVGTAAAVTGLAFNAVGHATGQKTQSFTADTELLGQTNGSYNGSIGKIMTAQQLANTKYSGYNNSGRHEADNDISEGRRQEHIMRNVIGYNNDRRDIAQSNTGILHVGREAELAGRYNLKGTMVGKKGMVLQKSTEILLTSPIEEFKDGGSLTKELTFIELVNPVNEFQQGGVLNFDKEQVMQDFFSGKAPFIQRILDPNRATIPDWENPEEGVATHRLSYGEDSNGRVFIYPEVQLIEGELHDFTDPKYKHGKWDAMDRAIDNNNIHYVDSEDIADFITKNYKSYIPSFQKYAKGGAINVIPEGALHARKHNMDLEGVTTKGIPVVSEKEGGEIEQQAEIEKEEIIFRLEVTKKLEELAKDGSDSAAIEAGKLLVDEILYNTVDKTNNLL